MVDSLYTKKTIAKMGQQMSYIGVSQPSAFALKQMKKMGWEEGQGKFCLADFCTSVKIKKPLTS